MPPAPRPALTRAPVRPHPLAPAGVAELTPAPEATTVMDWFHVTMRPTVLTQPRQGPARTPTGGVRRQRRRPVCGTSRPGCATSPAWSG
jgi:hypothetical protein